MSGVEVEAGLSHLCKTFHPSGFQFSEVDSVRITAGSAASARGSGLLLSRRHIPGPVWSRPRRLGSGQLGGKRMELCRIHEIRA